MDIHRLPRQGEIYRHFKDRLYQVIAVATHSETREFMVVYQALYGEFRTYVRPLDMFLSEVDRSKYPLVTQKYRFELIRDQSGNIVADMADREIIKDAERATEKDPVGQNEIPVFEAAKEIQQLKKEQSTGNSDEDIVNNYQSEEDVSKEDASTEDTVNLILLKFLDADSFSKKLDVLSSNIKHMDDRLINDMAVALDCTVDEGPLDQRIQKLIFTLQTMCRFEDRRLR